MSIRKYLVLATICLISVNSLFSQENVLSPRAEKKAKAEKEESASFPMIIGIEAGMNYNMFSQTVTWATEVPNSLFNVYSKGSGISPFFSALVEFPLTNSLGLQVKLSYDIKNFTNKYTGIADGTYYQTGQREDVTESVEYENDGAYLGISAQLRYNLTDNLFIIGGPLIQMPMGDHTQSTTISILTPGFYWDMNTLSTVKTDKVTISPAPKTRIGLEAGLGYKMNLSKSVYLVPQIRFQFMPTKVAEDESGFDSSRILYGTPAVVANDKTLHSVQLALGLWFQL
jgi:hypothetical protein